MVRWVVGGGGGRDLASPRGWTLTTSRSRPHPRARTARTRTRTRARAARTRLVTRARAGEVGVEAADAAEGAAAVLAVDEAVRPAPDEAVDAVDAAPDALAEAEADADGGRTSQPALRLTLRARQRRARPRWKRVRRKRVLQKRARRKRARRKWARRREAVGEGAVAAAAHAEAPVVVPGVAHAAVRKPSRGTPPSTARTRPRIRASGRRCRRRWAGGVLARRWNASPSGTYRRSSSSWRRRTWAHNPALP